MVARSGFVRDEHRVMVTRQDKFVQISNAIYVPPDAASYLKKNAQFNAIPRAFINLIPDKDINKLDYSKMDFDPASIKEQFFH